MNEHTTHVGIDIAKQNLDAVIHQTGEHRTFRATPKQIACAVGWIAAHDGPLVVMEATGGYERRLLAALPAAQIDQAVRHRRHATADGQQQVQLGGAYFWI